MTFIYVMKRRTFGLKIGRSKNPKKRVYGVRPRGWFENDPKIQLLAQFPHPMASFVERSVHAALEPERIEGEWFAVTLEEARDTILKAMQEVDNVIYELCARAHEAASLRYMPDRATAQQRHESGLKTALANRQRRKSDAAE